MKEGNVYSHQITAIAFFKADIKSPAQQIKFKVSKRRSQLLASQRNH